MPRQKTILPWPNGMLLDDVMAGYKTVTLFVFFGMIASGKSTLAEAWAEDLHLPYFNSDRVRKQLAGLKEETSQQDGFKQGIYSSDFSRRTYASLLDRAEKELTRGVSAVLDASYQNRQDRLRVLDLALRLQCRIFFILCTCREAEMKKRMERRARDPLAVSDGRWEVYIEQKKRFEPPVELAADELITIDTEAPVAVLLDRLHQRLANRKSP